MTVKTAWVCVCARLREKGVKTDDRKHPSDDDDGTGRETRGAALLWRLTDEGADEKGGRVGVSEGPSLLCAGVHGEGGGLRRGLAAAVFSV